jgi:hypothetical protein
MIDFSSLRFHICTRYLGSSLRENTVMSLFTLRKKNHFLRNTSRLLVGTCSLLAARAGIITALSVTRFAITNPLLFHGSLTLCFAIPLIDKGIQMFKDNDWVPTHWGRSWDNRFIRTAETISLISSIAIVVLGAAPLNGWGGVAIGINWLCRYSEICSSKSF